MANTGGSNFQVMPSSDKGSSFMEGYIRGRNLAAAERAERNRTRIFTDCMMGKGWYLVDE